MKIDRLAAAVVAGGGVLFGVATLVGIPHVVVDNYRHADVIDFGLRQLASAATCFVLGAYLAGQGLRHWRPHPFVPLAMAVASLLGAFVALVPLVWAPEATQHGLRWPAGALGAWAGARLAAFWKRDATGEIPWRRVAPTAIALFALAVAPNLGKGHTFPGESASPEARQAWAEKTFDRHYAQAADFVARHPEVRHRIGVPTRLAPIAGDNAVWYWQGKTHALFTLSVEGPRGRGVAHIRADFPTREEQQEAWPFQGTFLVGDEPAIGL